MPAARSIAVKVPASTSQLPPEENAAAQTRGLKRFDGFVQTLGLRLQQGNSFLNEIPDDILPRKDDADE